MSNVCGLPFGGKVFGTKCVKEAEHGELHSDGSTTWVARLMNGKLVLFECVGAFRSSGLDAEAEALYRKRFASA